jgi:hypothetical protein
VQAHSLPDVEKTGMEMGFSMHSSESVDSGKTIYVTLQTRMLTSWLQQFEVSQKMQPDLVDALLLDEPHSVTATLNLRNIPRKEKDANLEVGVWYLQKVNESCSSGKKCQASYSAKHCDKVLVGGACYVLVD